jgi:uncharacterized protein (TIGR00251 family)
LNKKARRRTSPATQAGASYFERMVASKGCAIDSFCAWEGDVLILNVLGTPAASKDAIGKPQGKQLRISVKASPVNGIATDYMVGFLAGEFQVSIRDIEVVFGRFNINKQLRIRSPQTLPAVIRKELSVEKASHEAG